MKVNDLMITEVKRCGPGTNLAEAVATMWAADCGVLPVVDWDQRVIGVVTDRDISIALGTRNKLASEIAVGEVISGNVFACLPDDDIHDALRIIQTQRVRRLPVIDREGKLQGILCLDDIALHAEKGDGRAALSYEDVINTMKAICDRRIVTAHKAAASH
ncbi:MAG TPA: CBS domain-containing protein [Blastocatellia bacterium]|jgi:CBS domain-containing protein